MFLYLCMYVCMDVCVYIFFLSSKSSRENEPDNKSDIVHREAHGIMALRGLKLHLRCILAANTNGNRSGNLFPKCITACPIAGSLIHCCLEALLLLYFLSSLPSSFFAQILPIFQGPVWILPTQWSLLTAADVHNYLTYLLWHFPSLFHFAPNHGWYLLCICILTSQRKFSMDSLERFFFFLQLAVE